MNSISRLIQQNSSEIEVLVCSPLPSPSQVWFLGEFSKTFGALLCLQVFPTSFGVLDLQGRGDYDLVHLKPSGLPRASRS